MEKLSVKNAKLIGIHGRLGAGKDTVGKLIQALRPRELRQYSFARPLKEGIKAMFGWDDETLENRMTKEEIDEFWGFSPRRAMQLLGTEYGRRLLRDDIWVHAAARFHMKSEAIDQGTIITDVRFENEATWVRNAPDSVLIHVLNPHDTLLPETAHESERGIKFLPGDLWIVNDKTLGMSYLQRKLFEIW